MDLSGAVWRTSSRSSSAEDDNCVEVAFVSDGVGVRDSKNPGGGRLVFGRSAWAHVLEGMARG